MADLEADIAIVGAGPAGASAAIRLAHAGRRVVLIDRKHFPRQKVCGGCLSGPAVARLRELLDEGQPLPGVAATCITFVIGNYRLTCRSDGRTQVVHRAELDAVLVEAATKAGADGWFGEPATIELADPGRNRFSVRVGNRRLEAGTVLIATGVAGLAGKLVGGRAAQPGMLAQQWVQPAGPGLPEPGAVELHWLRGGYVGLASPQAGECVVALAARVVQDAGESACDRLRRLNPGARLWNLLLPDAPRRYGARGTAGFPWRPRRLGVGNLLLIGDAAGYQEPYTGEGIGLALISAECATAAILSDGDMLARYLGLMRRFHLPVVRRARWLGRFLQLPVVSRLAEVLPLLPPGLLARLVHRVHVKGTL